MLEEDLLGTLDFLLGGCHTGEFISYTGEAVWTSMKRRRSRSQIRTWKRATARCKYSHSTVAGDPRRSFCSTQTLVLVQYFTIWLFILLFDRNPAHLSLTSTLNGRWVAPVLDSTRRATSGLDSSDNLARLCVTDLSKNDVLAVEPRCHDLDAC